MTKRFFYVLFIIASFLLTGILSTARSADHIQAAAHYPVIPVLKGEKYNPVIKVAVSVPAGQAVSLSGIQCRFLSGVLNDIERVEVFQTDATPFSSDDLLASVAPAALLTIPFSREIKPGVTFLWVSLVLKETAGIDSKILLRCEKLLDSNKKPVAVKQMEKAVALYTGTAVKKMNDDNVHTYRIPGIIQTDKGTLIAVYDIRYLNSRDLPGHIDVGMSRSTDNGKSWQPMKVIMDMGAPHENNGVGDPAILFDPHTKKIWVAALWSKGNRSIAGSKPGLSPDTTGQFVLASSADDGLTWSAPYTITPQVKREGWHLFFNGPGSGIVMQNGTLVFAAQYWDEKRMPYSTIIHSNDQGKNWTGNLDGPKSNTTESQVVETTPGTLLLNMRDNRGAYRSVATTKDMGKSWTEHATSYSILQDPVCMASIIKVKVKVKGKMQEVLFFSNPNSQAGRYDMTIKASLDKGETWMPAHALLIDERPGYGYSSLTQIDDQTIGILYEGIRDLYFIKIPVADIIKPTK